MYRLLSVTALALGLVVMTASAKEYKDATILKMDGDTITVKFDGVEKEVKITLSDKTALARAPRMGGKGNKGGNKGTTEETEVKKEDAAKMFEKAGEKGVKATITTEGDDKEDVSKDKITVKKILFSGGRGGMGKNNKDTGAKKDL